MNVSIEIYKLIETVKKNRDILIDELKMVEADRTEMTEKAKRKYGDMLLNKKIAQIEQFADDRKGYFINRFVTATEPQILALSVMYDNLSRQHPQSITHEDLNYITRRLRIVIEQFIKMIERCDPDAQEVLKDEILDEIANEGSM